MERVPHLPRRATEPRNRRDLTISRDPALRDPLHNGIDTLVIGQPLTPFPSPAALPSPGRGAPPPGSSPLSRQGGSAMGEGPGVRGLVRGASALAASARGD